jgi:hypothetical protein
MSKKTTNLFVKDQRTLSEFDRASRPRMEMMLTSKVGGEFWVVSRRRIFPEPPLPDESYQDRPEDKKGSAIRRVRDRTETYD